MQELAVATLGLLLFLTAASARSPLMVRVALLPAGLLAGAALLSHPAWPVPLLILLLGGGVLWSLAGRLKGGGLGLDGDVELEEEPTTRPLERALKMAPDTDPPLLVLVTQLLVAGTVLACSHWLGGGLLGPACIGALVVAFVISLLLVRRPISTWGVGIGAAWAALAAWSGIHTDPLVFVSGVGLVGALILGSVRDKMPTGIVAVMLALLAAATAVRPLGGLVSWFAGWGLLIGLVLLYLLVGLGAAMEDEPSSN